MKPSRLPLKAEVNLRYSLQAVTVAPWLGSYHISGCQPRRVRAVRPTFLVVHGEFIEHPITIIHIRIFGALVRA